MTTKPITSAPESLSSVEFNDAPIHVDPSFLVDVPLVPEKIHGAFFEPVESAVDLLFDFCQPSQWATFHPYSDYWTQLKRLFYRKVLSSFEPDFAIETLDNLHENGIPTDTKEGQKIYEMLYKLVNLNELLEVIYLKIFATLKP